MKFQRRAALIPALALPHPEGEPGGGGSPPAGPLAALANEGKNAEGESEADLDKWKPKAEGEFDQRLLPKDMRDENPHKAMDKMFKSLKGFRDKQAQVEKPPEKPDGYAFEIKDDKLKAHFPDVGKDPAYLALRDSAHEAGIPQSQYEKVVAGTLKRLVESGALPEPVTEAGEMEKLGGKDKAIPRVQAAEAFVKTAVANKIFDGAMGEGWTEKRAGLFESLWTHADGVELIELLQKGRQEVGMGENKGDGHQGGITEADIRTRRRDERYRTDSPKFDKAFRQETDRLAKQLAGAK